ncbi:MAG: hypothetical protein LBB42_04310 [Coriobacteriales bacterium]|nr:hypothetical protein [Coriobacteriales bacterium]
MTKSTLMRPACLLLLSVLLVATSCDNTVSFTDEALKKQLPNKLFVDSLPTDDTSPSLYSSSYMSKIKVLLNNDYSIPIRTDSAVEDPGLFEILLLRNSGMNLTFNETELTYENDLFEEYIASLEQASGVFQFVASEYNSSGSIYSDLLDTILIYQFAEQYELHISDKKNLIEFVESEIPKVTEHDNILRIHSVFFAAYYLELQARVEFLSDYIEQYLINNENSALDSFDGLIDLLNISELVSLYQLNIPLSATLAELVMSQIEVSYTDIATLHMCICILNNFNLLNDSNISVLNTYIEIIDENYKRDDGNYSEIYNMSYSILATCSAMYIFDHFEKTLPDQETIEEYVVKWYESDSYETFWFEDLYYYYVLAQQMSISVSPKLKNHLEKTVCAPDVDFSKLSLGEVFALVQLLNNLQLGFPEGIKERVLGELNNFGNAQHTPASLSMIVILCGSDFLDISFDKDPIIEVFYQFDFSSASVVDLLYYPITMEQLGLPYDSKRIEKALQHLETSTGYRISKSNTNITMYSTAAGLQLKEYLEKSIVPIIY